MPSRLFLRRIGAPTLFLLLTIFPAVCFAGINDGLVAYFPFNGNANDESGQGKYGTVNGATLTQDRFNTTNTAYSFDGVDDKIIIPVGIDAAIPEATISVWALTRTIFNPADPYGKDYRILIQTGTYADTFGGSMVLDIENGFIKCGVKLLHWHEGSQGDWFTVADTDKIIPNQWYNIVGKYYRGNKIEIWINGQLKNSQTIPEDDLYNSPYHYSAIGATGLDYSLYESNFWDGIIDEVRIYNRALSPEEIQALYTQSLGEGPPSSPSLLAPANNASDVDPTGVKLQWNPSIDPDGDTIEYLVILWEFGPSETPITQTTTLNNYYNIPFSLELNKIYYWNIWAKDSHGNLSQSQEPFVFSTMRDGNAGPLSIYFGLGFDWGFANTDSTYLTVRNIIDHPNSSYISYNKFDWVDVPPILLPVLSTLNLKLPILKATIPVNLQQAIINSYSNDNHPFTSIIDKSGRVQITAWLDATWGNEINNDSLFNTVYAAPIDNCLNEKGKFEVISQIDNNLPFCGSSNMNCYFFSYVSGNNDPRGCVTADSWIQYLTEVKEKYQRPIDILTIFAHGAPGFVHISGNFDLAISNVELMKPLRNILSKNATILLFSCTVGKDAKGKSFVQALANTTGATVYANTQLTGFDPNNPGLYDWDLDVVAIPSWKKLPPIINLLLTD